MILVELIKEGIISNDMEKIIQAYNLLTGEKIKPKQKQSETKEASKPPVQSRKERLNDLDFSVQPIDNEDGKYYAKSEAIEVGKNQFTDSGIEAADVTTPEVDRTPRRPPVKMVEVTCRVCGKKEELNAKFKTGEFHRCDKCVG